MRGLVIFDYDWSLINVDSDTFIYDKLQPELLENLNERSRNGVQWTKAVDETLAELTATKEQIIEAIAKVPVQPGMLDAVRFAHSKGWEVVIVSDANTVFIQSFLEYHDLTSIIKKVFTNPAHFNGNTLRVNPFHPLDQPPHGCPRCPTNMCKALILHKIKGQEDYKKIVYIGDGNGDFCPALTELSSDDVVFCRENYDLHKHIQANTAKIQATVSPWNTGNDILAGFHSHVE